MRTYHLTRRVLKRHHGPDNGIVHRRPHLRDFIVGARRMDTVRQENHDNLSIRVSPDRGPREPGMPERVLAEERASRAVSVDGLRIPAERPRALFALLRGEERDRF